MLFMRPARSYTAAAKHAQYSETVDKTPAINQRSNDREASVDSRRLNS